MLTVVSPAKTLDYESPLLTKKTSEPRLMDRSAELIDTLVTKSPGDVSKMMDISPSLAELNVERYQQWEPEATKQNARAAVLAFKGDVYVGMELERFDQRDFTEAQKSLRILSGLYGVLRPLDLMQPYRLEMGTKLKTDRGSDLYSFWGDTITETLNADLDERPSRVLVNLASNEYFGAVNTDKLDARLVSPVFLDEKNGNVKIISFFAKRARGSMAAWMIQNRIKSVKALEEFDVDGYRFDPERSTKNVPTFFRPESAR